MITPWYTAVESLLARKGQNRTNYIAWSGLNQLVGVVSLMSALTNGGGYRLAFHSEQLSASGFLGSLVRAREVQTLLLEHYPDGDHSDCANWALWKMETERKE